MRNQTAPDAETLERIRMGALLQLLNHGLVKEAEAAALWTAHVDDVLERLFMHCAVIRVRVSDSEFLEIHPKVKGSVH